jgi:phage baseplate assembly protein W
MINDYIDFYIKSPNHPKLNDTSLIEDDLIRVIIQKYEMIILTNKGDVFGDPNFGASLEELLNQTKVSDRYVKDEINNQIYEYIPEISSINYELDVRFVKDVNMIYEIMIVKFKISEFEVYTEIR